MHMKLLDPRNLANGSKRQRQALHALESVGVFSDLRSFSPVLAGTIPLDVDIEGSDLDIICWAENLEAFAAEVGRLYRRFSGFFIEHSVVKGWPTVLARFEAEGFPFEIFAQGRSVFQQPAVLHMLVEARLLSFAAKGAREHIRKLKASGMKTEPAFADCFGLEGDPYEELLKIAGLPDHEILHIAHRFLFSPK